MAFRCTYCDCDHPDAMQAAEHILPERIGNRGYIHRNACARLNQGFAHFVESRFQGQSTIGEILITLDPPRGVHFRYEVATERGTRETVYLDHGRTVLGDRPEYVNIDAVPLDLPRRDGTRIQYELKLPFPLLRNVTGSEMFLTEAKLKKLIEQNQSRLLAYAKRLLENPSIDPDFAHFIRTNDIELRAPQLQFDMVSKVTPKSEVHDLLPLEYRMDVEVAARYFAKVAFLFAGQTGHRSLLGGPVGTLLREFMHQVFVPAELALDRAGKPHSFFARATVAGEDAYAWAAPIAETTVAINTTSEIDPTTRERLLEAGKLRERMLDAVLTLMRFDRIGSLGPEFRASPASFAFHELRLVTRDTSQERPGIWCRISLFGDLFSTDVRLAEEVPEVAVAEYKLIKTRWHRSAQLQSNSNPSADRQEK